MARYHARRAVTHDKPVRCKFVGSGPGDDVVRSPTLNDVVGNWLAIADDPYRHRAVGPARDDTRRVGARVSWEPPMIRRVKNSKVHCLVGNQTMPYLCNPALHTHVASRLPPSLPLPPAPSPCKARAQRSPRPAHDGLRALAQVSVNCMHRLLHINVHRQQQQHPRMNWQRK